MASISIKRGATLKKVCTFMVAQPGFVAEPASLTGKTVTAQVRDVNDNLVATLTATPDTQANYTLGRFTLGADASSTALWLPAGQKSVVLFCDVKVVNADGTVALSQTFAIRVLKNITQ